MELDQTLRHIGWPTTNRILCCNEMNYMYVSVRRPRVTWKSVVMDILMDTSIPNYSAVPGRRCCLTETTIIYQGTDLA